MASLPPIKTILCIPGERDGASNVEVLNTNNVDSAGVAVLNDEKLLELVQNYPFLYNPRVRPFQDPDYDDWAWDRITATFNARYIGLLPPVDFTKQSLICRWNKLQPIIKKMAKMCDLSAIPEPLRQIVVKISVQLEDQTTDVRTNSWTHAQQIIHDNINMVERLPLDKRLQLEAEMLHLILTSELDAKATLKLSESDRRQVEQEHQDFIRQINHKEPITYKAIHKKSIDNSQEPLVTSTTSNGPIELDPSSENKNACSEQITLIDFEAELACSSPIHKVMMKSDVKKEREEIEPNTIAVPSAEHRPTAKPIPRQWIPIRDAAKHVRRCAVFLKRTNMEDYVPLSYIRRQRKSQTNV